MAMSSTTVSMATYSRRRGEVSKSSATATANTPSIAIKMAVGVRPNSGPVANRLIKPRSD